MRNKKGQFVKGINPWNKGMKGFCPSPETTFKKGEDHRGASHVSWSGGIQKPKNDCVQLWDGVGKIKRRPKVVFEENYGPVPSGYVIYHIDGDKHNDSPENLEAISRGELLKRNRFKND